MVSSHEPTARPKGICRRRQLFPGFDKTNLGQMYLDLPLPKYRLLHNMEPNDSQEAKLLNCHKYTTDNIDAKPQLTLFSGKSNLHLGSSFGNSEHQFWQTNTSLMGVVSSLTAQCSPRVAYQRDRWKPTYVRNYQHMRHMRAQYIIQWRCRSSRW
jgi:hypothetical protein